MAFSEDFLSELRTRADMESVASSYVTLKRRGRILTGLCPFHNEKTPSFTVYPETQSYYCFGCGNGGDVITFIKNIENLDYTEAVRLLADRVGLAVPQDSGYDAGLYEKRRRMFEANRLAARYFHNTLYSPLGEAGLAYFHERGLTDKIIRKFGLGFAPPGWENLRRYLNHEGFSDRELYEANLLRMRERGGSKSYYDAFSERVMFPIIDLRGNVLAFSGRALVSGAPRKYVNTSDTLIYKKGENLFALNFAHKSKAGNLILCEGNMDVVALHQAGFDNAVAGLGTALTEQQASLLSRYTSEVLLCYDNDEAGQKAVRRALSVFEKTTLHVKVIRMQGGKDPDEIIKTHGPERFRALLNDATNDVEYRILQARSAHDVSTSDGKSAFLEDACQVLADVASPVERDIYAARLAEETSVSKDAILSRTKTIRSGNVKRKTQNRLRDIRELSAPAQKAVDTVNPERAKHLRAAKAEETLLASFMHNPEFFSQIKEEVKTENFVTAFNARVFDAVAGCISQHGHFSLSMLEDSFTAEEKSAVAAIQTLIPNLADTPEECLDCIRVLAQEKAKSGLEDPAALSDADFLKLFRPN